MDEVTQEDLIKRFKYRRDDIRRLEAEVKGLKIEQKDTENQLMDMLDAQGLKKAGTDIATISMSEEIWPTVDPDHWEEVWKFLFENDYLEMMRKQLNQGAFKELQTMGIEIPHVSARTVRKLNCTSL